MDERRYLSSVLARRIRLSTPAQRREWAKLWLGRFDVNIWRPALFERGAHPDQPLVDVEPESLEALPGVLSLAVEAMRHALAKARLVEDDPEALVLMLEWLQRVGSALAQLEFRLPDDDVELKARIDDTGGISDA